MNAGPGAEDSVANLLNSVILADDTLMQLGIQMEQLLPFGLNEF